VRDDDLAFGPAPAAVTAAAPAGASSAVVTYTAPTASDDDGTVAVTCNPASGSAFPVGTTTVTCTATDSDDTPATVSTTFTVTVSDPPNSDLALKNVPGPITVVATSAKGAVVTFTPPTGSDGDGSVAVTCDPASGSTFPVGTTKVTCTAKDADDAPTVVSASFSVTVTAQGAAAELDQLEAELRGGWPGKSLLGKVEEAGRDVSTGKVDAACRALGSFVDEVSSSHDKLLTQSKRTLLIATAQQVEAALGCPKPGKHQEGPPGNGKPSCKPANTNCTPERDDRTSPHH
jgi:HYR domain